MKTEKHPYSKVVHYSAGGTIINHPNGTSTAEFRTLCHRKFKQGHDALMMSGAYGAERVTCKKCRAILDAPKMEVLRLSRRKMRESLRMNHMTMKRARKAWKACGVELQLY